jgi:hypothetical protein
MRGAESRYWIKEPWLSLLSTVILPKLLDVRDYRLVGLTCSAWFSAWKKVNFNFSGNMWPDEHPAFVIRPQVLPTLPDLPMNIIAHTSFGPTLYPERFADLICCAFNQVDGSMYCFFSFF